MTAEQPYQLMPPLTAEEYAALRDDIAENGVLVPIVRDQHGNLLDGHHRAQVAEDLGITYRVDVIQVRDEEHARSLARKYNLARRHLNREQKRQLIADEITANPDRSDRAIGRDLGCDHKTVGSVRREQRGEVPHQRPERIGFYRVHPFLNTLPWVDDDAFAGIVESIRKIGLITPITLTHDRRTMVDGRIRYRACEAAGVEPRFQTLPERYTDAMIIDYIVSMNVVRKHASVDQRAAVVALADTEAGDERADMSREHAEEAAGRVKAALDDIDAVILQMLAVRMPTEEIIGLIGKLLDTLTAAHPEEEFIGPIRRRIIEPRIAFVREHGKEISQHADQVDEPPNEAMLAKLNAMLDQAYRTVAEAE